MFFLAALVLALAVSLGAATAIADTPPVVTIDAGPSAEYTTAEVSGTVNPSGGPSATYWRFEYATNPDDPSSWQFGASGEIAGPEAEGTTAVPVNGTIQGLQPETEYSVRLVAENGEPDENFEYPNRVETEAPYPTFTTKGPIEKPTVSIDPITTFDSTTAHFSGTINPGAPSNDPGFGVDWNFVCTPECELEEGFTLGGHVSPDADSHVVSVDVSDLEPNTDYSIELIASNTGGSRSAGPQTFHTDAVPPSAETIPAFALRGGSEALVGAWINPHNSATTYWIEYGLTAAYGESAPVGEDASAGSGATGQILTQKIDGLAPATVYHFRVIAESPAGPPVVGSDKTFETAPAGESTDPSCPNATLRAENNSTALPECRAYEQVSPTDKNGFDIGNGGSTSWLVAAEDGAAVAFGSPGAFADSQAASLISEYLSRRSIAGWKTHALVPSQKPRNNSWDPQVRWFSPDLRYAVLNGANSGSIAPGDNPDLDNLYLRDNLTDTYRTLNLGGTNPAAFNASGASTDGKRVFFDTIDQLTPDAAPGQSNVYEWNDGHLKLASIRLSPTGTEEPSPGGANVPVNTDSHINEVSEDGTRAVFLDAEDQQLYLREDGLRTLRVSESELAVPESFQQAYFAGASADLSRVFFLSGAKLTDDARSGKQLYMYDVTTETVTDLNASALPGENNVQSVVGVSDDGEYVYFMGHGEYHSGDNQPGGYALYLWHDGAVDFIASNDLPGSPLTFDGLRTEARVSPDGRRLSFVSNNQLTSYDNMDAVPGEDGSPREDDEVYIYDATVDRLTCVSCNPSGQAPTGAPDGGPPGDSALPTPPPFQFRNLQPGVGDEGHLFFESRDALVSQDVNGKNDVYLWRDGRVRLISPGSGGTDSYLSSSSLGGDDVFIKTRQRLIASDSDDNEDIYDVRVGGGFPRSVQSNPCEGIEGCHGPGTASPPYATPATSSFSSPLRQPNPRAQRLRKACKHRKKEKARARCKAAAKKRHGKASNGRIR